MPVDYQDRARYLISQAGGFRAAATKRGERGGRRTALPRTTLTRIARGGSEPNQATKDRINRAYRRIAPAAVKEREKAGKGSGVALVDRRTAKGLERSYRASGDSYSVVAHGSYDRQIMGVGEPTEHTQFGRGSTVEEAEENLERNFERLRERYRNWTIRPDSGIRYRVYKTEEEA